MPRQVPAFRGQAAGLQKEGDRERIAARVCVSMRLQRIARHSAKRAHSSTPLTSATSSPGSMTRLTSSSTGTCGGIPRGRRHGREGTAHERDQLRGRAEKVSEKEGAGQEGTHAMGGREADEALAWVEAEADCTHRWARGVRERDASELDPPLQGGELSTWCTGERKHRQGMGHAA